MRRRPRAASPSPASDHADSDPSIASNESIREEEDGDEETGQGREPARKRRVVGERAAASASAAVGEKEEQKQGEGLDMPNVVAESIPWFRHMGYALETRAACLVHCFESASLAGGTPLATLPMELVELIGRFMAVGSDDLVRFAHPESLAPVVTLRESRNGDITVLECITSRDGRQFVASGDADGVVKVFDLASQECVSTLDIQLPSVSSMADISHHNAALLACGSHNRVVLWDFLGCKTTTLSGHGGHVLSLAAFSTAVGHPRLASGNDDGTITVWDLRTHSALATLRGHDEAVLSLCVFHDRSRTESLASGSRDSSIRLWDLVTHRHISTLGGGDDKVMAGGLLTLTGIEFLSWFTTVEGVPMLVSGSREKLRVWDMGSRALVVELSGFGFIGTLNCTADGHGHIMLAFSSGGIVGGRSLRLLNVAKSHFRVLFETKLEMSQASVAFIDRASGASFLAASGLDDDGGFIKLWTDDSNVIQTSTRTERHN
jgi:WD40 repeat protein